MASTVVEEKVSLQVVEVEKRGKEGKYKEKAVKYKDKTYTVGKQLHDLCLLSPAISAYSAVRYVPDSRMGSTVSRLISDHQTLDQHLPTTLSAPFSRLINAC